MMSLLKVNEAADYLHVSRSTVYRLLAEKQIPAIKFRGCMRIQQEDIDSYIQRSTCNRISGDKYCPRINYKVGMKIV